MEQANRVEDLTVEQLRDEVWYWRAVGTVELAVRRMEINGGRRSKRDAKRELLGAVETLNDALCGRYHDNCFACGNPIKPGMAVISDVNEGEMHANCDQPLSIKPGEKVFMDPESIVIDEDHPEGGEAADKPDHIVAHAASRLFGHDQMLAHLEIARTALAKNGKSAALNQSKED